MNTDRGNSSDDNVNPNAPEPPPPMDPHLARAYLTNLMFEGKVKKAVRDAKWMVQTGILHKDEIRVVEQHFLKTSGKLRVGKKEPR
jgi:hypothetical protein